MSEQMVNTIKFFAGIQNENCMGSIARTSRTKTALSLFSIDRRLPKLDVAGSTPVSRSMYFQQLKRQRYFQDA
jgi:hypothetical protein